VEQFQKKGKCKCSYLNHSHNIEKQEKIRWSKYQPINHDPFQGTIWCCFWYPLVQPNVELMGQRTSENKTENRNDNMIRSRREDGLDWLKWSSPTCRMRVSPLKTDCWVNENSTKILQNLFPCNTAVGWLLGSLSSFTAKSCRLMILSF
jgi:hypothetical protein